MIIAELARDEVCFWKAPAGSSDVLLYDPELYQSQTLLKKLKKNPFARNIASESLEVLTVLARSGAGIAILPERVVKTLAPQLKKVSGMPTFQDRITIIYRYDIRRTASASVLIDRLKAIKI